VYSLAHPYESRRVMLFADTPVALLLGLATLTAAAGVLVITGLVPMTPARAVAAGAAQGGLLATAVAWTTTRQSRSGSSPALAASLVLLGAVSAAFAPFGGIAYLAAPIWLWRQREDLAALGLARGAAEFVLGGVAFGAVLGGHLLVTASLTLHYAARVPTLGQLAVWLPYDVGANVLATEAFVRGALFDRAQRRWPFTGAAAFATVAYLARYLVDPLLPRTLEMTAGAIFYLTLLSLGNCWLYWRSGSIVPGLASGVMFFVCYRLLHFVQ
jgi:hypothetical protein